VITHDEYVAEREARDPAFREARERLRPWYEIRRALIGARLAAGLTQRELAERLGTTQSAIARLESGSRLPNVDTLYRLAKELGIEFVITPDAALAVRAPGHSKVSVASG
jgi:ribosome-binding protein aMBF1 (putative translation factor)